MENIKATVKGNKLTLEIDITTELGMSSSGKSMLVATTGGNVGVPGAEGVMMGINIYKPIRVAKTRGSK
jgi:hypothetical protein